MSATKKAGSKSSFPLWAPVRGLAALVFGRGRPVSVVVLVVGILYGGWYVVWNVCGVGARVLASRSYTLTPEGLEITPLPPWIHSDLRLEVFRNASLDGPLSIMDDRLVQRIHDVLALHPWVAKVHRVVKSHPARVKAEVDYRRPVCMVEVPGGLYPVDIEGVWLPVADFSPVEASQYPRLSGIDTRPVGSIGTRWGDARVVGGAEIAAALGPAWAVLQLQRITPAPPSDSASGDRCTYELFTRSGTQIVWGRAPGASPAGELPAAEKVARLRHYCEEHGALDGSNGPQQINVRGAQSLEVSPRTARSRQGGRR